MQHRHFSEQFDSAAGHGDHYSCPMTGERVEGATIHHEEIKLPDLKSGSKPSWFQKTLIALSSEGARKKKFAKASAKKRKIDEGSEAGNLWSLFDQAEDAQGLGKRARKRGNMHKIYNEAD